MCNKSSFHIKHDHIFEVFWSRQIYSISLAHLVVDEDEHDVRLVLLLLSGLAALSVPVILVGFGPMSRQAAEAEENAQHGQNRSRTRLHLYCTRGIKKTQHDNTARTTSLLGCLEMSESAQIPHERAISGPTRCRSRNHIWVGLANLAVSGIWNTSIWWSERERERERWAPRRSFSFLTIYSLRSWIINPVQSDDRTGRARESRTRTRTRDCSLCSLIIHCHIRSFLSSYFCTTPSADIRRSFFFFFEIVPTDSKQINWLVDRKREN